MKSQSKCVIRYT